MNQGLKKKVLVVGPDGLGEELLSIIEREKSMPFLTDILRSGKLCYKMDCHVEGMGRGWPSFMTGVSPRRHGAFYWDGKYPNSYLFDVKINSKFIKYPRLWDMAGSAGLCSGVVNMPLTYPPSPLNGYMLCGLGGGLSAARRDDYAYPGDLIKELTKAGLKYERGWFEDTTQDPVSYLKMIEDVTIKRTNVAMYFDKSRNPDLSILIYRGLDSIQHYLWNFLIEDSLASHERPDVRERVFKYFKILDNCIEQMVTSFHRRNGDGIIIFVSDHGFGQCKYIVNLNVVLSQAGLLTSSHDAAQEAQQRLAMSIKKTFKSILPYIQRNPYFARLNAYRIKKYHPSLRQIDWKNTKAFMGHFYGVYLNVEGREPLGIVKTGDEYEALQNEIISILKELKEPFSGRNAFSSVYRKQDLNLESSYEIAPDILYDVAPEFECMQTLFDVNGEASAFVNIENEVFKFFTGSHRREGIFAASGPGIEPGLIDQCAIIDCVPTILEILGVQSPSDLDGRSLVARF